MLGAHARPPHFAAGSGEGDGYDAVDGGLGRAGRAGQLDAGGAEFVALPGVVDDRGRQEQGGAGEERGVRPCAGLPGGDGEVGEGQGGEAVEDGEGVGEAARHDCSPEAMRRSFSSAASSSSVNPSSDTMRSKARSRAKVRNCRSGAVRTAAWSAGGGNASSRIARISSASLWVSSTVRRFRLRPTYLGPMSR